MNYYESIAYLEEEIGFTSCPGLTRVSNLLKALGNPQNKCKVIHIAGTNGKGSATAMLLSILKTAGYKTGAYTSPHLARYNERFVIDGVEISDSDFANLITKMREACDQIVKQGLEAPTLFEVVTGAAYYYFAEKGVDLAIMEVGLGGRFDATNVVESPLLSVIMSISMDHTDFLGNTIEEIAAEKAGIIKKNCPVVLYCQGHIVYNIIRDTAKSLNAPLIYPLGTVFHIVTETLEGTTFSVKNDLISYENLFLPLLGRHQLENCVTVLTACATLEKNGLYITENHIRQGLAQTAWAGRLEVLQKNPLVVLDGAHNVDGIRRLAESAQCYFSNNPITLIMGVLGDKEYEKMAESIFPLATQIILTEPHNQRKLSATLFGEVAQGLGCPFFVEAELESAFAKALTVTPSDGVILCCGSLYMIGALRSHLCQIIPTKKHEE